jgi:hypothetical protein
VHLFDPFRKIIPHRKYRLPPFHRPYAAEKS